MGPFARFQAESSGPLARDHTATSGERASARATEDALAGSGVDTGGGWPARAAVVKASGAARATIRAMRTSVLCLVVAVAGGCSRSSGSGSPGDPAKEPFARAAATLKADHPTTLPDFGRAMGTPPAECALVHAMCTCTWRFVTAGGVEEVVAHAAFVDARETEPETVPMVAGDDVPVELAPDEAERGYRAGRYNTQPGERLPVSTAQGDVTTVASENLTEFLNGGGHIVSPRALKAAALERTYATWTPSQRLEACTSQPGRVSRVSLQGHTADW